MIAALADASYKTCLAHIERYQLHAASKAHEILNRYDARMLSQPEEEKRLALRLEANRELAEMIRQLSQDTLDKVLYERSNGMKNAYARADA